MLPNKRYKGSITMKTFMPQRICTFNDTNTNRTVRFDPVKSVIDKYSNNAVSPKSPHLK